MGAGPGLASVGQGDFRAGMVPAVARHLIPAVGLYSIQNGLLDDDGSIYRRGGSEYKSNAAFGASLRWLWDGAFAAGQRTVFASPTAFGTLAADDVTPASLGGAGLSEPKPSVLVGGILFFGGGLLYGGSRKTADYSTGTVAVTNGSRTVTGTTTAWNANVDAGMLLRVTAGGRYYVVASVNSDTSITLTEAYEGATAAGAAYTLGRLGAIASHVGGAGSVNPGPPTVDVYATVANRLVACSGSQVRFSEPIDPGNITAALVGNFRTHNFPAENLHDLPGGAAVVAAVGIMDRLLVFTTAGLFVISNMSYEIVDVAGNPQHRVERLSQELIGWGAVGVAPWENSVIVAAVDGVYAVDGISSPVKLSRSITPKYTGYVRLGYKPGQAAVYNSHLFLPILDSGNAVIDLLVCRLDRPVETEQGVFYPWSSQTGHGGNVAAFSVRVQTGSQRSPELLGAGRSADARVLKLGKFFEPGAAVKNDADATTHIFQLVTRDFATGSRNRNVVRFLRLLYELEDAGSDNPLLTVEAGKGLIAAGLPTWNAVNWNAFNWPDASTAEWRSVEGSVGETAGRLRRALLVNLYAEFVRYRITSSGPAARLVIRELESMILPSGKNT